MLFTWNLGENNKNIRGWPSEEKVIWVKVREEKRVTSVLECDFYFVKTIVWFVLQTLPVVNGKQKRDY